MRSLLLEGNTGSNSGSIIIYVILIVVLVVMLVLPFFTNRKKNKEYQSMIDSLKVGDSVRTIGGVIGKIIKITDKGEIKTVILETGSKTEKSYMEFDITTIYCVLKSTKADITSETAADEKPEAEKVEDSKSEEKSEEKATETAKVETKTEENATLEPEKKTKSKSAVRKRTNKKV